MLKGDFRDIFILSKYNPSGEFYGLIEYTNNYKNGTPCQKFELLNIEDQIAQIFPKKFEKENSYEISNYLRKLKENLKLLRKKRLEIVVKKCWMIYFPGSNLENKKHYPKDYPTKVTDMIDWLMDCIIEKDVFDFEKRAIEKTDIGDVNVEKSFILCGISVPSEVMNEIFMFIQRDINMLNSIGLINEQFYFFTLKSWNVIKINKHNLYKIPLLVLKYATNIEFNVSTKVLKKDFEYFSNNVSLNLVNHLSLHDRAEKYLKFLKNKKFTLKGLKELVVFGWIKKVDLPNFTQLPKLHTLTLPFCKGNRYSSKNNEVYFQLKHLKYIYYENDRKKSYSGSCLWKSENVVFEMPPYLEKLENLRSLIIDDMPLESYFYEDIGKLKNLKYIRIMFSRSDCAKKFVDGIKYLEELNLNKFEINFNALSSGYTQNDHAYDVDIFESLMNCKMFFSILELNFKLNYSKRYAPKKSIYLEKYERLRSNIESFPKIFDFFEKEKGVFVEVSIRFSSDYLEENEEELLIFYGKSFYLTNNNYFSSKKRRFTFLKFKKYQYLFMKEKAEKIKM